MTETFNMNIATNSNSESLKTLLPVEPGKQLDFHAMAEWIGRGNAVEDFPADFERDIPWPNELAEDMKARRLTNVDVDEDFWTKYPK